MTEPKAHAGRRWRAWLGLLRGTPLHPQWLVVSRTTLSRRVLHHARGRVVDVGCADRWAEQGLPAGCQYIGIDYPHTGLALYGGKPDVLADAAALPMADGIADTVLLLDVLEHLRHPQAALAECARVLRPGGCLLLAVPFLYPIHDAPHDYQRLTPHGLFRDVRAAGLDVLDCRPDASALESAGLLVSLALAGTVYESWRRRSPWLVAAPLLLALVPLVNLACWLGGKVLPGWNAMAAGYTIVARKA